MIERLRQANRRRRYSTEVRRVRSLLSPGDRIRVLRGDGNIFSALVLNVRAYAHGSNEAFVQGDDNQFSGWVPEETILPFEAVPTR
jgi:hypothetical protein